MTDSFIDGFCLKLENLLLPEQVRIVKNLLSSYVLNYTITPKHNRINFTGLSITASVSYLYGFKGTGW